MMPPSLHIEINNFCNSKCIICPLKTMKRKPETMDFNVFKKIIDELKEKDYSEDISPFFIGEPFLVPNILDYLRYLRQNVPRAYIRLFTNASKLTSELSHAIIKEQLFNRLVVSFDGGTKEAYESVRVGLSFDEVRNNVHEFIRIRNGHGKKTPLVEISMVVTKNNKNTTKDLEQEFKDANMVTFHKYFEASVPGTSKWIYNPMPKNSRIKNFLNKRNYCYYFDSLMILSNGVVANCCADYEGLYPLGDCKKETIEQIWNGEILKKRKEDLKHRRFKNLPFCANCDEIDQNILVGQAFKMEKFFKHFPRIYKVLQIFYAKYG